MSQRFTITYLCYLVNLIKEYTHWHHEHPVELSKKVMLNRIINDTTLNSADCCENVLQLRVSSLSFSFSPRPNLYWNPRNSSNHTVL